MFKKNTAVTGFTVGLVSATDGSDITTGTPVGYYTLDGGTQTAIGDVTPVHEGNGEWSFDLLAAEMNGDIVGLTFTHASAITAHFTIRTDTSLVSEVKAETALIVADTNELQTDNVPGLIATAQADLDTITDTDGVILGAAGVDLIWDEVISGAAHNTTNTAGRRIRELRESGFYSDGFIYIDTVNGAADSTDYEAGTEVNPTNSIANANTIAASLNLHKFKISPGSTITLAAAQNNQLFEGDSWTLALGGQNVGGSTFKGATVSGICTNTAEHQYFSRCLINAVTIPTNTHLLSCGTGGTITLGEPGNFFIEDCHSAIAGSGSVTLDWGSPATETNVSIRHHSGGWTMANMGAGAGTCNASFEGNGQIVWDATCVATSNASIRGNWKITDNASGAVTETLDDNQTSVDAILVDTGTTIPGTISTAQADLDTITGADGVNLLSGTQTSIDAIEADTNELQTDDIPTTLATLATTAELNKVPKSDGTTSWNATALGAINAEADTALTDYDPPTRTEATSDKAEIITDLDDIKGTSFIKDTHSLIDLKTETALIVADTNELQTDDIPGTIAALNNLAASDILTTALTESYNTDGSAFTLTEALYLITQMLTEKTVAGTVVTVKKLDGSATALTLTLNDGTSPTSVTRAT